MIPDGPIIFERTILTYRITYKHSIDTATPTSGAPRGLPVPGPILCPPDAPEPLTCASRWQAGWYQAAVIESFVPAHIDHIAAIVLVAAIRARRSWFALN